VAELITVARPYAQAAFALAGENNALPVWAEMLKLASAVVADPKVHAALDNPRLSAGDKEALFLSICGDKLNAEGRNFVRVLVQSDRIGLLPEIRQIFDTLKDDADGVARAHISSAFPVTDSELAALKAALEKRFGKRIETSVAVDPDLIGGATIVVGDTVIDGSIRGELQAMATHLQT
jgi:F-type H+-transporting ATPase subunit delta